MATTPQPRPQTEEEILEEDGGFSEFEELIPGLTPELEKALLGMAKKFMDESDTTWRYHIHDFLEAEAFWNDIQDGFYDYDLDVWRMPNLEELKAYADDDSSRFDFTTNIYRAFGWTLVSVLGQKLPTTRWLPVNWQDENDVIAAKEAGKVTPIIERNNRTNLLNMRVAYLLYNHGICGGYTRYVEDGERFGYKDEDQIENLQIKIQDGGVECPYCNEFSPTDGPVPNCPTCGAGGLTEAEYVEPEMAEAPMITGTVETERGQEVISIHGGLELKLPPWEPNEELFPYVGLENEVHRSKLKSRFGKRAEALEGAAGDPYDAYGRYARLALTEPAHVSLGSYQQTNQNLITLKQWWFKPSSLEMIEKDDERKSLQELFPKGVAIVFTPNQEHLLSARAEDMNDRWSFCHALDGSGTYTPSLGKSTISVQKRTNVLYNFVMEWVENAAAGQGTFVNSGYVDIDALKNQRRRPGRIYPLKIPMNMGMSNVIWESRPGAISGEIFTHMSQLERMGQTLSGAVPTVSGGTEQSLKPTTYLADREQALGKLFVPWTNMREFWAKVFGHGVKEFVINRSEDEHYAVLGRSGEYEGKAVSIENLQNGEFLAYPETNENFPALWHQLQATFMRLMESQDPFVQRILGHSKNIPFSQAMLGLPDMYVPGEDDRAKQDKEIALLLQDQPIQEVIPGPEGEQIMLMPSIPIDDFEDDHAEHEAAVREWAVSPAGIEAKQSNPAGYMNVIAHGKMHRDYQIELQGQLLAAQNQAAMAAAGAEGGDTASPAPAMSEGASSAGDTMEQAEATKAAMEDSL